MTAPSTNMSTKYEKLKTWANCSGRTLADVTPSVARR
jgi:hypothetical protein